MEGESFPLSADLAVEESSNSKSSAQIGVSSYLLGWQIKIAASRCPLAQTRIAL